jgi:membrane protein implicated in regulation of membrane protease activity
MREQRRLLVLAIVAALLSILAAVWYERFFRGPTTEERARRKAEELRGRIHDLTHGE